MCLSLYDRACALLSRREHTCAELTRKLTPHDTPEAIAELMIRLKALGFVSDTRFAAHYISTQRTRLGTHQLTHRLRTKGVPDDIILTCLEEQAATGEDELTLAHRVRVQKFGSLPSTPADYARQARFLQWRGFSIPIIHTLLKQNHESA